MKLKLEYGAFLLSMSLRGDVNEIKVGIWSFSFIHVIH